MRPAWRLAISTARTRLSRTLLLVGAVVLSAALIAAVACAMESVSRAVGVRLDQSIGKAHLRIKPLGSGKFLDAALVEKVRKWPEVSAAVGRSGSSIALAFPRPMWVKGKDGSFAWKMVECLGTAAGTGLDPDLEPTFRQIDLVKGRLPRAPDEIVIDAAMAERFGQPRPGMFRELSDPPVATPPSPTDDAAAANINAAYEPKLGDTVQFVKLFRSPIPLKVVGFVAQPPFGARWQCLLTFDGLARLTGESGRVDEIDIILKGGSADADRVAAARRDDLGPACLLQTTERITSGLDQNVKSSQLGFVLATVMAFLAAAFIIATGLSTAVTERQRELAVLRCIGAEKSQLATVQLLTGVLIGGLGGLIGTPLGVLAAWSLANYFREELPVGLAISVFGLVLAVVGSVFAGVVGAAYPAWRAMRVSPLEGLSVRAAPPRPRTILTLLAVGLGLLVLELCLVFVPKDGQTVFWGYATTGLPAMFVGYFLLGVPVLLAVVGVLGWVINKSMGLPAGMLSRTIRATPYRYGFTASAMMSGLAILVALWTQGRSINEDWLGRFKFPDAFVTGLNLKPEAQAKLNAMPFVTGTCAITLHPVETGTFGVKALQKYKSMFIAFEPRPFFEMTRLTWVEPTDAAGQERAQRRLAEGGAVLVAREFQVARGVHVGDSFKAVAEGREAEFEIVGVVTSPGLEIVSKFFAIGEDFTDQAIHAVFGSRDDLRKVFGSEAINLIQVGLDPKCNDAEAVMRMRTELIDYGLLDAGSGRRIKEEITKFIGGSLLVASAIGVFAMLIASFGVANIIVAGIHARRFEFGVLRAIGGSRGLLVRLVLAEAVVIAISAMVLGTALGLQGILSGQRLDRLLFGLELSVRPPLTPLLIGWVSVLVVTLLAAGPAAFGISRQRPRELLAGVRG